MKRNLFSPRLYLEGLRQLRLMGILFTVGVSLIAVFSPISAYVSSLSRETVTAQNVGCTEINPLITLAFCIVAPFLVINLFSFVNKRESSDFYHAIPATRGCLFFSFFAAVVTWLFAFIAISTTLSVLCYAIFPQLFIINYTSVLMVSLNCFVGSLFIASCTAIAMSLTGTLLMNVLLALLLIFLPRALLLVTAETITSAFPLVNSANFIPFINPAYNIPVGFVFQYMVGNVASDPLTEWSSTVYTLVMALIYMGIALVLFRKRRSEGAGHSAPTPTLQAVYRLLIGFTVSSFITLVIFAGVTGEYTLTADEWLAYGFLYLLSVLAMVVFEILCTRRFQGLLRRSAVSIALLIAANVVLFLGAKGTVAALTSYRPDADNIQSVRITQQYDHSSNTDYFAQHSSKVEITDPQVLGMVSEQLKYSLDLCKAGNNDYWRARSEATPITVYIRSGWFETPREIILYQDDVELLSAALNKNTEYRNVYMTLPQNYSHIIIDGYKPKNKDAATRLVNTLQLEINRIGFEQWYEIATGSASGESFARIGIYVPTVSGWSTIEVPLYPALLPETSRAYLELFRTEHAEAYEQIPAILADIEKANLEVYDLGINTYNPSNSSVWFNHDELILYKDELAAIAAQLSADTPIDPEAPFCMLQLYCETFKEVNSTEYGTVTDYAYHDYTAYFAVTDEIAAQLDALSLTMMEAEGKW